MNKVDKLNGRLRILLINPPISTDAIYGRYASAAPVLPPLGFCYIAAVMEKLGHDVRLLDCPAEECALDEIRSLVLKFKPQVVGITCTTVSFVSAKLVINAVKEIAPDTLVLLGGAHISALPRETIMECPALDIGVYGEGEETVVEILETIAAGDSLLGIKGICFRRGSDIVVTPPRPLSQNLDLLPMPARHLLRNLQDYSPNPFRGYSRAVSLISSRGCTFDCSYCDQSVFNRRWRGHGAKVVVAEMRELQQRYGFDFFSFEDDHFLLNQERVVELCETMLRENLKVAWTCSARANSFTPEILRLMKKAGCRIIYMGIESGSKKILWDIDKGITVEQIRIGVKMCADEGIKAYGAFMIGTPDEEKADIEKTLEFALSLPLIAISCFIYVPYPGTPLRVKALKEGFVSDDWRDYSAHPSRLPFVRTGMSQEFLLAKQREFYNRFYLRPSYLLGNVSDWLTIELLKKAPRILASFFQGVKQSDTPLQSNFPKRARFHT